MVMQINRQLCCCVCGGLVVQFTSARSVAWDRIMILRCQAHGYLYGVVPITGMVQQDHYLQ